MEVFDDSAKVGTDVVLLPGFPQSCMPNPVESLFEVYEDIVEILLVLGIFLTENARLKICSVVLLPTLRPAFSSALVSSIYSVWPSAWLCFCDWWGSLFGSSGTAAGFLSWEVWWLRTWCMWLAILLSAKSCCRLSREWCLHSVHLIGPVLLGCRRLQLTSLSSMIVLQPPLLCEGWGGHLLCLSGYSSVLMDLHWPCGFTAQSSILSICSVSVALLWGIFQNDLDSSCFPLFHSGQVFHQLVCPLTVVLSQIFCNLATLFFYSFFILFL